MIVLPSEFRGEPVRIVVKKEPPMQEDASISINDFLKKIHRHPQGLRH